MDVPALTINKVCLSGLDAIALADQLIRAGEFEIVVAGGMESMTNAPHLLPKSREGYKYGDVTLVDSMAYDALTCAFDQVAMGVSHRGPQRDATPTSPARRRTRSRRARTSAPPRRRRTALFDEEIAPVEIPQRKGDPIVFAEDEGIRADTTAESLAKLRPAFAKDGTITAGSSSQISDGAAAVVVMSKAKAEELGLDLARRDRRARRRRRPGRVAAGAARQRDPQGARPRGADGRRPRPGRDQRGVRRRRHRLHRRSSASTRTRSTSTAAPSRSATRSACPARASCSTSRSSSSVAAAASARPRCAAAAARATP